MTELQQAIENLYDVFARYPKPAAIEFCPCGCTKPEEVAPLLAAPLREIPSPDLVNYAFSAMTTQGSRDDFRYLLPRLFQAIVEDLDVIDPEILFGKLSNKMAKWDTWPEAEVNAVREYLIAFWKTAVNAYPIPNAIPTICEIETVLCCLAVTDESLDPYLKVWTETHTIAADENLIQLVTLCGEDFAAGQTPHKGFWENSGLQSSELRRWILRPDTMQRIQDSAHLLRNDGWEHLFEPALAVLREEAAYLQDAKPVIPTD